MTFLRYQPWMVIPMLVLSAGLGVWLWWQWYMAHTHARRMAQLAQARQQIHRLGR